MQTVSLLQEFFFTFAKHAVLLPCSEGVPINSSVKSIIILLDPDDDRTYVQLISLQMERPWPLQREIYGLYAP